MNYLDTHKNTIEYYNTNTIEYVQRTLSISMESAYQRFLSYLPPNSHILDAGCGSGRDSKFFLEQGYRVSAIDASSEMVKSSSLLTNLPTRHQTFQEISEDEVYDGIWANASLLHVPATDLTTVYDRLYQALKKGGICFASYKLGCSEEIQQNRYFHFVNEETIKKDLSLRENIELLETWYEEKENGQWIQFITRKKHV